MNFDDLDNTKLLYVLTGKENVLKAKVKLKIKTLCVNGDGKHFQKFAEEFG